MNKTLAILGLVVVVLGTVAMGTMFTVNQMSQAIVMQFGEPMQVIREPGLNFKTPFVQDVVYYDKRILDLDPPSEEVILADKKRVIVDAFARYRIVDPLQFFQSVRTELRFRDRFGKILNSSVRNVMARHPLIDVLSEKRDSIMESIQRSVTAAASNFGIEVVDVRIGRTDLPSDISKNVFERMRSEREREANLLRAEGDEAKQRITAAADRKKTVILARANREARILIGEGEAEKTRILGEAHNQGKEFYTFLRSMEFMRNSFGAGGGDTTVVLSPDSELLGYFRDITGKAGRK